METRYLSRLWTLGLLGAAIGLGQETTGTFPEGVIAYLSLDRTLDWVTPAGEGGAAQFGRASMVYDERLEGFDIDQPRYVAGRFGSGVRVEPGVEGVPGTNNARNYFDRPVAEILPDAAGQLAYETVGRARLKPVAGPEGAHVDTAAPVLEGGTALLVGCAEVGAGVLSAPSDPIMPGSYTVSFFARGEGDGEARLRVELVGADGEALAATDVDIGPRWRRVQAQFTYGQFRRGAAPEDYQPFRLRVTALAAAQAFRLDGVVLEMDGGYSYANMSGATSWMPGYGYRASEQLSVPDLAPLLAGGTGSVAFWCRLELPAQQRRVLFELATGNRWQPLLQLAYMYGRHLAVLSHTAAREGAFAADLQPGSWHHLAVTWEETAAAVYLDGKHLGDVAGLSLRARPADVRLGSSGPNAPGNVVVDEAVFLDRRLSAAEVGVLAARQAPLAADLTPPVLIRPRRWIPTIARTFSPQQWRGELRNTRDLDLQDVTVELRIGERLAMVRPVGSLAAGASVPFAFSFIVDLPPGLYPFEALARVGDDVAARLSRTVEITRAAEPEENLQVSPWGSTSKREYGLTMGGGDLEETMRAGQSLNPMLHYLTYPQRIAGPEYIRGIDGKPFRPRLDHPYIRRQIAARAEHYAQRFADVPAMKGVIINSEMQWLWQHEFAPDRVAWVKETFGLDISPWSRSEGRGEHVLINPYGRLRASAAGVERPPGGIVEMDNPFYAYHRWFHGPTGPTESYLNQQLAIAVNRVRPDILTVQEPILRRPATRAFDRVRIGQEWFYYENPMTAVSVQERLHAATRGTPLRFTGMPQFLFKKGTVAPYNAIASGDLYHETVWLCALQPIRMFTYYNFNTVPDADFENAYHRNHTPDQLAAFFGTATPTWDEAEEKLAADPDTARKLFPWSPGLIAAFRRFHTEEIGPLGALVPRWQNRPRKVAVVHSFANQLWYEERWPNMSWLENNAVHSGMPFDVLYDYDFETGEDALAGYELVILSRTVALPRPAYEQLQAYARRGGIIVVDSATTVEFPNTVAIAEPLTVAELRGQLTRMQAELRVEGEAQAHRRQLLADLIAARQAPPRQVLLAQLAALGKEPPAAPAGQFFALLDTLVARVRAAPDTAVDYGDKLQQLEAELTARYGGPTDHRFLEDISTVDLLRQLPDQVSGEYRQLLSRVVHAEARSLTPNTWLNVLEADGANYLGIVNDLRTIGPMYGHFGRIREQGVPQTARVRYRRSLGTVVYDLLQHRRLEPTTDGDHAVLDLPLEGAGARVLMLVEQPIGRMTVMAALRAADWGDHRGREFDLRVRLHDQRGRPMAGMVPVTLTIEGPDGTISDFSGHHVVCRGVLDFRAPVDAGAAGRWRLTVFERASGQTVTAVVTL